MIEFFGTILYLIFLAGFVLVILAGVIILLLVCLAPIIIPIMLIIRWKTS